jgi:hypothetical protein
MEIDSKVMHLWLLLVSFAASTAALGQDLWTATADCRNTAGLYGLCSSKKQEISVPPTSLTIPEARRLFFSLTCSRYIGRAPLVSLKGAGMDVELGFTKDPTLQSIQISDPKSQTLSFNVTIDPNTQFSYDCKIAYYGFYTVPNILFVEGLYDNLQEREKELQELELLSNDSVAGDPQSDLLKLLDETEKRQVLSCVKLIQQANRRTATSALERSEEMKSFLAFAIGSELSSYEKSLDADAFCKSNSSEGSLEIISGMAKRLSLEVKATRDFREKIQNLQNLCQSGACQREVSTQLLKISQRNASQREELVSALESYLSQMRTQSMSIENALRQDFVKGWLDIQRHINSDASLMQIILDSAKEKP